MSVTDAVVLDVTARLSRDLRATLGDEHAAIVRNETSHLQADAENAEDYADRAVSNVQECVQEWFIDTTWPRCPRHSWHPLWYRDGAWWCESDGVAIASLGSLGPTTWTES